MKHLAILTITLLTFAGSSIALEVEGVDISATTELTGETLHLNGYGIRKKIIFIKVYVGSLYTEAKAKSTAEVLALEGSKLIRMNFLYKEVEKKKIVDAFAEGFEANSLDLVATPPVRQFLALFKKDFVAGDQVDIALDRGGTVRVLLNGACLGKVKSAKLARGILLIYLGDEPADEEMKTGMLGQT
mgnify:CR=1 FL=1